MNIKHYSYLPDDAKAIRQAVFVDEQGFKNEFDDIDGDCVHIVIYDGEKPIATGRYYIENGNYTIGRVAVLKPYRGTGLGVQIVREAERLIKLDGGDSVVLHAQCRVKPFYEKQGYSAFGEIDYDEYCPHCYMKKEL